MLIVVGKAGMCADSQPGLSLIDLQFAIMGNFLGNNPVSGFTV
jgi:hypothetical protein